MRLAQDSEKSLLSTQRDYVSHPRQSLSASEFVKPATLSQTLSSDYTEEFGHLTPIADSIIILDVGRMRNAQRLEKS
jgi:hypothetical protein